MSNKLVGLLGSFALVCTLMISLTTLAGLVTPAGAAGETPSPSTRPQENLIPATIPQILAAHNQERSAVGVSALVGSMDLNRSAQQWANHLAAIHQLVHSGPGENLWMGTKGAFTDAQKVGSWIAEKRYFIPGRKFPDVSTTGKWQDVGHYTQVIWYSTTAMGCGKASDTSFDYLVCQYRPAGNVIGQYPLGHP